MTRRLLLTGANGVLGHLLARAASADPTFEVVRTGRGPDRSPGGGRYVECDVASGPDVDRVFGEVGPTDVVHCAAMTDVDRCETDPLGARAVNAGGTRLVTEACAAGGAYLLHLSTDMIFDGAAGPYDESARPAPINHYGTTKLEAEEVVASSGLAWSIVRTVLVFGPPAPGGRSNIVLRVRDSLASGREMKLVDDQFRTPTFAPDLAAACLTIVRSRIRGIMHVAGEDVLSPYQAGLEVASVLGADPLLLVPVKTSHFPQPGRRPLRTGLLTDAARRAFGFAPTPFGAALRSTLGPPA